EHQSQLFTPFFTTRSSGTGLGLAVVHSIITAHRGVILFDSQLDKGSTFILQLPHYATT
ncbi:MAG TPA: PAS domain-containing sensor histidine kinase, partial [Gammaproteobacteria bacterium]|nr:PAS domain-containing sensor histidine kinase [Gammaproteobacteria bacterium]